MKFPIILKWSITNKCNLRCKHCFLEDYSIEPTMDEIKLIIDEMEENKIGAISLTGGEIFTRKDIFDILDLISNKNIPINLSTNGILINDNIIKKLCRYNIKDIQISLDGSNKKTHDEIRGFKTFEKTIRNIKKLVAENFQITLAFTINKFNMYEIDELVSLGKKLKVNVVRFELFIPLGTGLDNNDLFSIKDENLSYVKKQLIKYIEDPFVRTPVFNSNLGCGAGTINGIINADMTLSPCDLLAFKYKTERKINKENSIKELWNNDPIFKMWNSIKTNDTKCNSCPLSSTCGYGCKASALAYNNDINSYDPLCLYREEI